MKKITIIVIIVLTFLGYIYWTEVRPYFVIKECYQKNASSLLQFATNKSADTEDKIKAFQVVDYTYNMCIHKSGISE